MSANFQVITPRLTVSNATEAIEWYKQAWDAKLVHEVRDDKGQLLHGELEIENIGARFYIQEDVPELHPNESFLPHANHHPMTIHLTLMQPSLDNLWNGAVSNGAKVEIKLERHFWGSVYGKICDPFGYIWTMSTPVNVASKHQIRQIENSCRGIFMDCSVGSVEKGATHANKDEARAGFEEVCSAVNEMGLEERIDVLVAISNENPQVTDPAAYSPGVILQDGDGTIDWDGLAAKNDRFVVKDVPNGRWFVYCHGGSYDGLSDAWKKALDIVGAEHRMEEGWCHERYLNSRMKVSTEELLTEIWIKIH